MKPEIISRVIFVLMAFVLLSIKCFGEPKDNFNFGAKNLCFDKFGLAYPCKPKNDTYHPSHGAKCLDNRDCPKNTNRSDDRHSDMKKEQNAGTSVENSGVWSLPESGRVCIDMNTGREYDCDKKQEPKLDSKNTASPDIEDYHKFNIFLLFPRTKHLKHGYKHVFGTGFAKFKRAQIIGRVRWQGEGVSGPATGVPVVAFVDSNNKTIHRLQTRTDRQGRFSVTVPVNPHGRGIRRFYVTVIRYLQDYVHLPKKLKKAAVKENKAQSTKKSNWEQKIDKWHPKLITNPRYHKISNTITKNWAKFKDFLHKLTGGKGSPNLKQWDKNHREGRDYANSFNLIKEGVSYGLGKSSEGIDKAIDWAEKGDKAREIYRKFSKKNIKKKESFGVKVGREIHKWFAQREILIQN